MENEKDQMTTDEEIVEALEEEKEEDDDDAVVLPLILDSEPTSRTIINVEEEGVAAAAPAEDSEVGTAVAATTSTSSNFVGSGLVVGALCAVLAVGTAGIVAYNMTDGFNFNKTISTIVGEDTNGVDLIDATDMTEEEMQEYLKSLGNAQSINISVPRVLILDPNTKDVKVNFLVPTENNGYAERFEIEQNGKVIYRSQVIKPGQRAVSANIPEAQVGDCVLTVWGVNPENGLDKGNPTSCNLRIETK